MAERSVRSPFTISAPRWVSAWAAGESGWRVMARTERPRWRRRWATAPPCLPVAPVTRTLFMSGRSTRNGPPCNRGCPQQRQCSSKVLKNVASGPNARPLLDVKQLGAFSALPKRCEADDLVDVGSHDIEIEAGEADGGLTGRDSYAGGVTTVPQHMPRV